MTDYTKQTASFSAKDGLPEGDPNKTITGVDFDAEFDLLQTTSATKADVIYVDAQNALQFNKAEAITAIDGTVDAPSLSFASETDSGLYRAGANDVRLSLNGADITRWHGTGVTITNNTTVVGTLTSTSSLTGPNVTLDSNYPVMSLIEQDNAGYNIDFAVNTGSGLISRTDDAGDYEHTIIQMQPDQGVALFHYDAGSRPTPTSSVKLATNGSGVTVTGTTTTDSLTVTDSGTALSPAVKVGTTAGGTDTGLFLASNDVIGVACGGTLQATIDGDINLPNANPTDPADVVTVSAGDSRYGRIHAEARISIDTSYVPTFLWSNGFSATITQENDDDAEPFIRTTLSNALPAKYRVMFQASNSGIGYGITSNKSRAFVVDYAAGGTDLDFQILKNGADYNNVLLASDIATQEVILVDIVITEVV